MSKYTKYIFTDGYIIKTYFTYVFDTEIYFRGQKFVYVAYIFCFHGGAELKNAVEKNAFKVSKSAYFLSEAFDAEGCN